MTIPDFPRTIEDLKSKGFTIHAAEFSGDAFGNWVIEFSSKSVRRHCLIWNGKEPYLALRHKRSERKRTSRISPEQLRQMNYEDGVVAYHHSVADAWEEHWLGREEADWTLDRALKELR